jgi:hypothetical protein
MKNNFIPNPRVPLYSQRHKDQIRLGFCVLAGLGLIGVCAIVWFFRTYS